MEEAWGLRYDQVSGPETEVRFEVIATLPKDTSKEQYRIMLLTERFHLAIHRDRRSWS